MVFAGVVSSILTTYLGDFIEGFDPSHLQFSILTGEIKLENVHIKKSLLDDLGLPIVLRAGFIGSLRVKIPWKKFTEAPVEIFLEKVYILLSPSTPDQSTETGSEKER